MIIFFFQLSLYVSVIVFLLLLNNHLNFPPYISTAIRENVSLQNIVIMLLYIIQLLPWCYYCIRLKIRSLTCLSWTTYISWGFGERLLSHPGWFPVPSYELGDWELPSMIYTVWVKERCTLKKKNRVNNSLHLWSEDISLVEEWISLDSNSSRIKIHYSASEISSGSLDNHSKRSDHWRHYPRS